MQSKQRTAALALAGAVIGLMGMALLAFGAPVGTPARAQEASLTTRVAVWTAADGTVELCFDLRDAAAGETRVCPPRRTLSPARAPEGRWLRSQSVYIAPEVSVWVRARRVGTRLDVGLGVISEGQARSVRRGTWHLDWEAAEAERWTQTSATALTLPVAPHPELWPPAMWIAPGAGRLEAGKAAPAFALPELGGAADELVSLSAARGDADEVTVIVFWSSWAPRAAETLAALAALDKVQVIAVNIYEESAATAKAMAQQHDGLTHLLDTEGAVAQHYRVDGVPELIVLDSAGIYRETIQGPVPTRELLAVIDAVDEAAGYAEE